MIKNQLKTTILLALLSGIIVGVAGLTGSRFGLMIGIFLAIAFNFGSYWFSDKIILKVYKAREIPKEHKIYVMIKELSHLAKIPTPKAYFITAPCPNAFATGRNYKNSAVALTESLIKLMSEDELKAVISHELSHIKHRDILIQTIAVGIATAIAIIVEILQWTTFLFGFGGDEDDGVGSIVGFIALLIITPIIATIIQLAISRQREFLADEGAAKIMRTKYPMINALMKLEHTPKPSKQTGKAASESLFIICPFKSGGVMQLFSTHPSTQKRIQALKKLKIKHR